MSVNRKRCESECVACHNARPSVFGRWCDRCWSKLTHEEQLLAAEMAAAEEDDGDVQMAPPRLARAHERRDGGGGNIAIAGAEDIRLMRARGYEPTTLRTPFGGIVFRKVDAR